MVEYAERMAASWHDGETRDLLVDMTRLTLEIIAKTLFGGDVSGHAREIGEALTGAMSNFNNRFFRIFRIPESIPTPANLQVRRGVARLDNMLFDLIHHHRAGGGHP